MTGIVIIYSILTNITKGTRPFCGIVANTPKSFINTFSMKAAWSWNALVTLYSLPTNFTCTLVWAYTVSMFPTALILRKITLKTKSIAPWSYNISWLWYTIIPIYCLPVSKQFAVIHKVLGSTQPSLHTTLPSSVQVYLPPLL